MIRAFRLIAAIFLSSVVVACSVEDDSPRLTQVLEMRDRCLDVMLKEVNARTLWENAEASVKNGGALSAATTKSAKDTYFFAWRLRQEICKFDQTTSPPK